MLHPQNDQFVTTRATRRTRRALSAAAALLLLTGLAACSGDDADTATPLAPQSPLPSLKGAKAVLKDVVLEKCDLEKGEVTATGKVTNTGKKTNDFAITVAWMPNTSTSPVGVSSTTVPDLAAQASATWTITTMLPDKADRCALNARSGSLS